MSYKKDIIFVKTVLLTFMVSFVATQCKQAAIVKRPPISKQCQSAGDKLTLAGENFGAPIYSQNNSKNTHLQGAAAGSGLGLAQGASGGQIMTSNAYWFPYSADPDSTSSKKTTTDCHELAVVLSNDKDSQDNLRYSDSALVALLKSNQSWDTNTPQPGDLYETVELFKAAKVDTTKMYCMPKECNRLHPIAACNNESLFPKATKAYCFMTDNNLVGNTIFPYGHFTQNSVITVSAYSCLNLTRSTTAKRCNEKPLSIMKKFPGQCELPAGNEIATNLNKKHQAKNNITKNIRLLRDYSLMFITNLVNTTNVLDRNSNSLVINQIALNTAYDLNDKTSKDYQHNKLASQRFATFYQLSYAFATQPTKLKAFYLQHDFYNLPAIKMLRGGSKNTALKLAAAGQDPCHKSSVGKTTTTGPTTTTGKSTTTGPTTTTGKSTTTSSFAYNPNDDWGGAASSKGDGAATGKKAEQDGGMSVTQDVGIGLMAAGAMMLMASQGNPFKLFAKLIIGLGKGIFAVATKVMALGKRAVAAATAAAKQKGEAASTGAGGETGGASELVVPGNFDEDEGGGQDGDGGTRGSEEVVADKPGFWSRAKEAGGSAREKISSGIDKWQTGAKNHSEVASARASLKSNGNDYTKLTAEDKFILYKDDGSAFTTGTTASGKERLSGMLENDGYKKGEGDYDGKWVKGEGDNLEVLGEVRGAEGEGEWEMAKDAGGIAGIGMIAAGVFMEQYGGKTKKAALAEIDDERTKIERYFSEYIKNFKLIMGQMVTHVNAHVKSNKDLEQSH